MQSQAILSFLHIEDVFVYMDNINSIQASEHPEDKIGKTKTIYDVSSGEVIWLNFLAGFSRGLGAIIAYLIFVGIFSVIIMQFVWPIVAPLFGQFLNMTKSLENIQNFKLPTNNLIPQMR